MDKTIGEYYIKCYMDSLLKEPGDMAIQQILGYYLCEYGKFAPKRIKRDMEDGLITTAQYNAAVTILQLL